MSDGGLPIIVGVIALACGFMGVLTNRRFGHPTFFAPNHKQSKWSILIPNNADENISLKQRPPPQPQHTNLPRERPAVVAAERSLGGSSSSGSSSSSSSSSSGGGGGGSVFADLPAAGVVEYIASFLSPADLVGVAPICVDLSRVSACEVLWKAHCLRIFGKVDSLLGEPWREAQRRQQQRREQSQCSEAGGGDEPANTIRRGRGQQLLQQLPNTQFRRNVINMSNNSSIGIGGSSGSTSTSTSRSLHPTEALTGSEDAQVKIDQPASSNSSNLVIRARASDITLASSSSPPPSSRAPSCPHLTCSSYHLSRPQPPPCPSCSSLSWKEAFFYAHRKRPRDLLELAPPATSCVVLVHGRVHDLTDFLPSHPGGSMILREHASTDATGAFERFFHSREARRIAREFVVWDGVEAMGREGTLWKVARDL